MNKVLPESWAGRENAPHYQDPTAGLGRRVTLPNGERKPLGKLNQRDLALIAEARSQPPR